MALEKRNGKLWFREELYNDSDYGFLVSEVIVPEMETGFQKLSILNTPRYGKVLTLDGIVQLTEEDEAVYHEFMAHWPLFSHSNPKSVLVVGGGDLGVAREILKHKSVKELFVVDIDPAVTQMIKKHIPGIPNEAFLDSRLKIIHEDAEKFIKKIKNKLDVLILDSTDPIGPAISLFGADFIQNVERALKDGGIMIRQAGSIILQPYEFKGSYKQMEVIFGKDNMRSVLISMATYFGGYFGLIAAVKGRHNFTDLIEGAGKKYKESKIETKWYSGKIHKSLAVLPPVVKSMIRKERYGEEIAMDLRDVKIPELKKAKEWSVKTCEAIKMIAFGQPMVSDKKLKEGTSFVQYIETSAINYRQLKNTGAANVFTCAVLPEFEAMQYSMKFLGSKKGTFWHLPRGSFGSLAEIKKETKIFDGEIISGKLKLSDAQFSPTVAKAEKVFSPNFKLPISKGAPAFELVLDFYNCDYSTISSCEAVARWDKEITEKLKLIPIGKADAPDFGHAKKKTAGPSITQFFEGGSNISHYSSNWLALFINIVSQKEFDLKTAVAFTMKFFKAHRAVGWIIPRGAEKNAQEICKESYIFEVKPNELEK